MLDYLLEICIYLDAFRERMKVGSRHFGFSQLQLGLLHFQKVSFLCTIIALYSRKPICPVRRLVWETPPAVLVLDNGLCLRLR